MSIQSLEGILLSLSHILIILLISISSYTLLLVIYRLTLHPLAKYPGPFWAKLTDWYSVYHAYRGTRHLEFYRCHELYGPVFRYGPNSLSFNTASALKTIYGHKSNVQKSEFYSVFPPTKDTFNTHSSIDKSQHARKRRVLSHAFSDAAIRTMERYVLGNVRTFIENLGPAKGEGHDGWSAKRNMSDWANYLTFDVMGDLCFGKAFNMLESPQNRHVIDLLGSAAHMHLILGTNPIIKTLGLNKVFFGDIYKRRMQYMTFARSQAMERTQAKEVDRKDFFHYLLNARDPETGAGFTMPELWGEANLLIIAGSDTTSTALAATFFYLVRNPDKLARVEQEVQEAFANEEEIIGGPKLNSCLYLRACIDEAMRLSPPVGGILPRETLPGGLTIDSHALPAGTVVGVPTYAIHHNEHYFPSPFTYNPDRWLDPNTTAVVNSAFAPFSVGPRGCIGKGVAYLELMVSLGRVLWRWEMRSAGALGQGIEGLGNGRERVGEFQLKDSFTSMKDGPLVEFRPRLRV